MYETVPAIFSAQSYQDRARCAWSYMSGKIAAKFSSSLNVRFLKLHVKQLIDNDSAQRIMDTMSFTKQHSILNLVIDSEGCVARAVKP